MSNIATPALNRSIPGARVLGDTLPGTRTRDVALVLGGAGLVGLLAQITIHLSFTPVPITGQTLGVLLVGTALGWRRGMAAIVLYATAGLIGVPWFANGASGYVGANFGYILGFVVAATVCGYLAERRADRRVLTSIPAMVVGEVLMYTIGVAWLAANQHLGLGGAIREGFTPFWIADSIKCLLAAALLPGAWLLVGARK